MTEKEIRQLNRRDLLEMMIGQAEIIERQKQQIEELEAKLNDKMIKINNAGSLAEAVLDLNGVFAAAQAAADQYRENVLAGQAENRKMLEDAQQMADRIVAEAKEKAEQLLTETQEKADGITSESEQSKGKARKGLFSRG